MELPLQVTDGSALCLEIPCDIRAVRQAVDSCRAFLEQHLIGEDTIVACELALAEACNNAIAYSKSEFLKTPVALHLLVMPDILEIQIYDHALAFDWPSQVALPSPDSEHGRGLFIIHALMDEVSCMRGPQGNCLRLRKKWQAAPGQEGYASGAGSLMRRGVAVASSKHRIEQYLMAHELQIARNIQQSLLPQVLPSPPGFNLAGYCLSAREVGGDFYDILTLPDDNMLLVVADVMGKGVPAALFAATFRTLVRTMSELACRPAELLTRINRLMFTELSGVDMFITAQLALLQTNVSRLVVASAGHCPAIYADEQGESRLISPEGMPLGILREAPYREESLPLHDNSRIVFYTDGLIETRNQSGEFLGQAKLVEWLCQAVSLKLPAAELKEMFLAGLQQFQGCITPTDDQTLLVLEQRQDVAITSPVSRSRAAELLVVP